MRDMLDRLQALNEEQEEYGPELIGPEYDVDKSTLYQQAVTFENSSDIDEILTEAHSMRKDISLLRIKVERMRAHNERFSTTVNCFSLLKKDSDSMAREIQQFAESLYVRVQALGQKSTQLEEKEGHNTAVSRIARAQYDTLTLDLQAAMSDYGKAEEMQKVICRGRIQRQASILGTQISDKQLDELVDKGGEGWTDLSQSLQTQGVRSTRWALCEIKGRHKELVELEARMKQIHTLFMDMAMLVEEQGSTLNNIEASVCKTEEYIENFNVHIKKAIQYKKKNPFLQCCPCLPCWKHNKVF
ncbi:syntaxin-11-like [Mugil cephalus]|uniref:syntaxin-11-like n=1 Tax=Mugil cephalus TaxID=48193 RepID=UPI001FB79AC2|nr:syntaxin-11-like [Mugil cephalus]